MPLLPALRWGDARWWLPLGSRAAAAAADHLSGWADRGAGSAASSAGGAVGPSGADAGGLEGALRDDPAFLIWAALAWHARHDIERPLPLDLHHLARWLADHLAELLAADDPLVAQPAVTASSRRRWAELAEPSGCEADPEWPARRLDSAAAWLEVTGPRIPEAWRSRWPRLTDLAGSARRACPSAAAPVRYGEAVPDLARLAAVARRARRLSERFAASVEHEKREALYQLAYGLSHEINNPLANISTRAQHLLAGETEPDRQRLLRAVVDQAMRAHEMIADLMYYARPAAPNGRRTDAVALVLAVAEPYREQAERRGTQLEIDAGVAGAAIFVDPDQWSDALRVLLRNALEAVGVGGRVTVGVRRRGARVEVEVADDGPGLDAAARRHAFDPYYCGREAGRGLGLGLSKAERIARLNGGGVRLAGGPAGCVATLWTETPANED